MLCNVKIRPHESMWNLDCLGFLACYLGKDVRCYTLSPYHAVKTLEALSLFLRTCQWALFKSSAAYLDFAACFPSHVSPLLETSKRTVQAFQEGAWWYPFNGSVSVKILGGRIGGGYWPVVTWDLCSWKGVRVWYHCCWYPWLFNFYHKIRTKEHTA